MIKSHGFFIVLIIFLIIVISFSGCSSDGVNVVSGIVDTNADILINEIVSSNSMSLQVPRYGSPDWIELYNNTDNNINLEGYTLQRSDSSQKVYEFPSFEIPARGYIVVLCTESKIENDEYCVSGFKLPKEGSNIILQNADSVTVSSVQYPALDTDISYCIYDGSYKFCVSPTPGEENSGLMFDTIDEILNIDAEDDGALVINEANHDFVELYNISDHSIQLALYCLSDDEGNLSKYRLPEKELGPGEYHVVYFGSGSDSDEKAGFSLNEYETNIFLSRGGIVCDSIDIYGAEGGASVGRLPDGTIVFFASSTPGEMNSDVYSESLSITDMSESSPVRISELLLKNSTSLIDENGDRPAWVEIHNFSDLPINLNSYYLSDDETNLFKWQLPDMEIPADGYEIIYLTGMDSDMSTSFKVGEGEPIILTDMNSAESQMVLFPDESRLADISFGEKDGVWLFFGKPTPGKANTTAGSESITNADKLDKSQIYINEVSAVSNIRSGEKDWIEIYNPSEIAVSLDGVYLSDDDNNLKKYSLTGQLDPGSYLVIEASSASKEQGDGIAPFSISGSGETLFLTDDIGAVIDSFDTGVLGSSYSSGRAAGDMSGSRSFFYEPTRGSANSGTINRKLNAPDFSVDGGVVSASSVNLELTGEGTIYYTLDGSVPDSSSAVYSTPINLSSSTCVSAICCNDGYISSDVVSRTYLFENAHSLPVICLSLSQSDLSAVSSSSDKKIIIERRCYVEYYDENGALGTSFPAGLRIGGNGTRMYSQRTFQVFLRGGYGQSSVVYPFFENYPITEFKSLVLRNEGQDNTKTRMRDTYAGMLFDFMNIDNAQGRFVVVYINGSYWGIYDLKENQNEDYFASRAGVDASEVTTIRRNTMALSGSSDQIKDVYSKAQSWDMSNDENYRKFSEMVDVDCFIDHLIARGYTADFDMFNQKYAYSDNFVMKVRPTFYDCDFAFSTAYGNVLAKYFTGEGVPSQDGTLSNMYIPTALKKNDEWREKFINRVAEVMKLLPERSLKLFDEMYAELKPEMERHIARWHTPSSMSGWESSMQNLRSILEKRPKIFLGEFQSVFNVSNERMHELFPEYY